MSLNGMVGLHANWVTPSLYNIKTNKRVNDINPLQVDVSAYAHITQKIALQG